MIRNTALLTLLVFTFSLFTPILMQPKEAEADLAECAKCVIETINENSGLITMVFTGIAAVAAGCVAACTVYKTWQYNECTAVGTKNCAGTRWTCTGDATLGGCGNEMCICQQSSHDNGTSTCTNDRCQDYETTYRNCVGHTCSSTIITSTYSYSGSYW